MPEDYQPRMPVHLADSQLGTVIDADGVFIARAADPGLAQLIVDALNAPDQRQIRERTLREAADLLDSKPLHCEKHGNVTCTECPVGSDHLRILADQITRGEA